nr:S1 RNA-binding domain-containing protein [Chloroflexota bacterium]
SELSWNKVNNPEAGYKVGDEVEAEVIDINHERGRISLSIRRLQPDPWHSTVADFRVGDVIEGTVTKLVNFGAFVRVRDGLEGLIHISELSHQRVAHPGDVVREGQTLKLKIISLDSERHRLGLSLKQAEEPPARPAPEARPRRERPERGYSVGDAVQEPEGGIDNTLAAAFAQVRQQLEAAEAAETVAPAAEAVAEEAVVEAVLAEDVAEEAVADAIEAEAVAEEAVVEAVLAEDVAAEAVAEAEEAEAIAEVAIAGAADDDVAADAVADAVLADEIAEEAVAEAAEAEAVAEEAVADAIEAEAVAEEAVVEAVLAEDIAEEAVAEAAEADKA